MSINCKRIIDIMEKIAPTYLAEDWDNVGLQIGDKNKEINKVMVCLEANQEVLNEAISKEVDMIITHHPLIFKPIKKMLTSDPIVNIINKFIKHDINLYCAHTNLDIAIGGTSDYIGKLLELNNLKPLTITYREKFYKVVVFVPESNLEEVRNAMGIAGAGKIGNYSHCTYQSLGTGTFMPLKGSDPYIGKVNTLEKVKEYRLESIVSKEKLNNVIQSIIKAHSYEEVAYDIIPLANNIEEMGIGRIGYMKESKSLEALAENLKEKLKTDTLKIVGKTDKIVEKIAICTGSGSDFIKDAYLNKCDCYITGDIKYHEAQYALQLGLTVIDAGHFETENIISIPLKDYIIDECKNKGYNIDVITSDLNLNPFRYI